MVRRLDRGAVGDAVLREPVAPGDHLGVAIDRTATGSWRVELADATAGWTWSATVDYPATGASAEWIEEAPGTWATPSRYQTLADYGSVTFTTVRVDGAAPASVTAYEVAQSGSVTSYPATCDPASASFAMHYGAPPAISSVSPPTGPSSGRSIVELSGQNFGASSVVRFGGVDGAVVSSSTYSIVVRPPGNVPVTVDTGPAGTAAGGATFDYVGGARYVVAFSSGRIDAFTGAQPATVTQDAGGTVVGVARDVVTDGYWEAKAGAGSTTSARPTSGHSPRWSSAGRSDRWQALPARRQGRGTGWSRASATSSVPPARSAHWAPSTARHPSSACPPRLQGRVTGSSRPTAGSSRSARRASTGPRPPPAIAPRRSAPSRAEAGPLRRA